MNKDEINSSGIDEKEKTEESDNLAEEKTEQKTDDVTEVTEEKKTPAPVEQGKVVKKKRVKVEKVIEKIVHKKEKRKLEGEEKTALKLAYRMKRKKPKFLRPEFGKMKRLEKKWRRPRGIDSKLKVEKKGHGALVKIGYKKPDIIRHFHPSGFKPIQVFNTSSIEKIKKEEAIIIASKVGRKKRNEIIKMANRLNITVLNPRKGE